MIVKLLSNPRFLAAYSGILTITFAVAVTSSAFRDSFSLRGIRAAVVQSAYFDEITARRITVVEPDGTPRLVIAGKTEFPGAYFKGKDIPRSDRAGYASMIFMDDEGTENGGLIFGGHLSKDGTAHSFGHLSFDEYESNQTLSLDTSEQGSNRVAAFGINDNDSGLRTPEVLAEQERIRKLPDGAEKQKAFADLAAKYHIQLTPRGGLERKPDKSVALRLRDPDGNTRILLRVTSDGAPSMQFLDASGKVTHFWPESPAERENCLAK
jgi:hypothetical protein